MNAKLTEFMVGRTKPPQSGRLEVWDSRCRRSVCGVHATGARSYVVNVRKPGARPRRIKVGEPGMSSPRPG